MIDHRLRIDPTLEALGRVGGEIEAARPAHDGCRPPKGRLQIHIRRAFRIDRRALTAHDAGQTHRTGVVTDHAHRQRSRIRPDLDRLAIEQFEPFALPAPAHLDAALQRIQVEDVGGPAQFQQHVVGNVDQRRQRALAGTFQPLLHPVGRGRCRIHTANDPAGKAAAQRGFLNIDRQPVVDGHGSCRKGGQLHRCIGQGGQIARHPEHRHAVGQVGRELEFEDFLVQIQRLAQILTRRQISGQLQNAGMIIAHAEFAARAEHAAAFHPPHLRFLDAEVSGQHGPRQRAGRDQAGPGVGGAADDLHRFTLPHFHVADLQAVGVRMLLGGEYARHHHTGKRRGHRLTGLDFQPAHRQDMVQPRRIERRIAVMAQPFLGNSHDRINQVLNEAPRTVIPEPRTVSRDRARIPAGEVPAGESGDRHRQGVAPPGSGHCGTLRVRMHNEEKSGTAVPLHVYPRPAHQANCRRKRRSLS